MTRRIVAVGGRQLYHPALTTYVLGFSDRPRPKVVFLATASGDAPSYIELFYAAYATASCEASHLLLFDRPDDVLTPIATADVVIVGGGNTANALAIWRLHGIDRALRAAYDRGCVLTGWSAGCLCWFECGITDSWGTTLRPLNDGLGFLSGSACPHYDGEVTRRPTYQAAIRAGMPAGYAADDGVGLHFADERFVEAVTARPEARAYRVDATGDHPIETRLLGG